MNILLVSLDQAKLYPPKFHQYIESKGITCYLSRWRKEEVEDIISANNLSPENTIIHARVAGLQVNDTFKNLEKRGYRVINKSNTLEATSNKYKSYLIAEKHAIPCAKTVVVNKQDIQKILETLKKYKIGVLKPVYSQGLGKYCKKIADGSSYQQVQEAVEDIPGEEIIVQEFIHYAKLIRVIVINYIAVKEATTYDEPKDDWKASVCMNPDLKKYDEQNPEVFSLAEEIARSFTAEISFIDIFENEKGEFILNEINTACGFIIHDDVTGLGIYKYISDYLIQQVHELNAHKPI